MKTTSETGQHEPNSVERCRHTYPTKQQKQQSRRFMSPISWLMLVVIGCWQCGHTVCTGAPWNISPCSTVTVVVVAEAGPAPGGTRTVVAAWALGDGNWAGYGPAVGG